MGHVWVVRLWHLVKQRNLAFDLVEVEKLCSSCVICDKIKSKFFKNDSTQGIGATQPLERLTLSIVGPIAGSDNKHKFLLSAVDEYSQFCWGFSMPDRSENSITKNLTKIFTFSGAPTLVGKRANSGIITPGIKKFLWAYGVATSKINPTVEVGNSTDERFFGGLWRTIKLLMADSQASNKDWHSYLQKALQAQRTLLNPRTNATPHAKMFTFDRQFHDSVDGHTPSWLSDSDKVIFNDISIDPPLAQEVQLIQSNDSSAQIKLLDGQNLEVDTKHLYPIDEGAR